MEWTRNGLLIGTMNSEMSITKKMLAKLREGKDRQAREAAKAFANESRENDNFLTKSKILMEEAVKDKKKPLTEEDNSHGKKFEIKQNTPQFGDVRTSQEEGIRKAINDNVKFEENALVYYPDADDITLDGEIPSLSLKFQFRYAEPSGDGCFIFCNGLQLTETNTRLVGKIRDAFSNWRDSITQDSDLMSKLKMASNNND